MRYMVIAALLGLLGGCRADGHFLGGYAQGAHQARSYGQPVIIYVPQRQPVGVYRPYGVRVVDPYLQQNDPWLAGNDPHLEK